MEEDEELRPAVQNLKLTDIYEPSVLVEKMLTDKDELIRAEDIPERLQLLRQDQTQPFGFVEAESDLDDEAAEIARQLREQRLIFGGAGSDADTKLVQVIRTLLYFMRGEKNHFLEVPFIAAHRKDYWQPYLGSDSIILWKIYELDLAYQARVGRTKELEALVRRVKGAAPDRATIDPNLDQISDYVETVEGVQDLRKYIFLHYGADLKRLDADEGKQLSKAARTAYELAREHGIGEVAKHYNLDVNSFVQSCVSDRKYFFPDDDAMEPFQAVSGHVNARYREEKHLVAATNKYLAEEIASHPQFRRLVRQKFELSALISVKPTAKGKDVITEEHEYFGFKYLTNKPVAAFKYGNFGVASDGVTAAPALKGQYALIARAVAEGLVTVDVDIADRADWVSKLERFIESDNTSEEAQMWNRHRRDILSMALSSVSQDATKWIKSKLLSEATDSICIDCRNVLGSRLMAAPFQRKKKEKGSRRNRNDSDSDSDSDDDDDDDKYRRDCRVAAVSWGEGGRNDPTYAVTLDEDGLVASYIQLNRMQDRGRDPACVQQSEDPAVRPPELAKPPKIADLERLGDFLVNSRPDVVVMAASTVAAMRLFQDVKDAVDKVRKSHTFLEHLEIHWILDDTATVWKNSAQAKAEFREYPEILRFCIGLARKAQDPVMAYASLFNTDQDIAKVSFIDKQSATPKDVLVKHMERAIVNAVAYVGVDINAAVKHRHKSYTLQFVSGLGPRKAGFVMGKVAALIEEKEVPGLEKRADLVSEKILGANVFFNCASFIRIRKYHFGRRSAYVDVLDDTRIHPEDYELARQMASDALDMDDLAEDEENPSQYVEELMSSKDMAAKLNDLDLDGYADELEKRLGSAKRLTLNDIKKELQNPYEDERTLRQLYPTIPELFYMLTKEPVQRFYPQHGLLATIRKKISRRVFVELPGGVEGEIEANEDDEVQRQAEGALIKVEIKDILVDAWKRTDMDVSVMTDAPKFLVAYDIANRAIMSGERDAAFDKDREREDERRRQEEQRKRMASQAMENVSHPLYRRDLDAESSERELASRAVGDIILRPSSKIGDLVAVVKMDENTYWHIRKLPALLTRHPGF